MIQFVIVIGLMILMYRSLSLTLKKYEGEKFEYLPLRIKSYVVIWYLYALIMPYLSVGAIGLIATVIMIVYAVYDGKKKR